MDRKWSNLSIEGNPGPAKENIMKITYSPDLTSAVFLSSCLLRRLLHSAQLRLRSPNLAVCIKDRPPVLKGRASPHRPRGRASVEVYSSKLAPTMGPMIRHNCQAGPVQQARDSSLSLMYALQHPSKGPPLPYESQRRDPCIPSVGSLILQVPLEKGG
eukprot:1148604-Pelagomonas_calceolata.AAC.1